MRIHFKRVIDYHFKHGMQVLWRDSTNVLVLLSLRIQTIQTQILKPSSTNFVPCGIATSFSKAFYSTSTTELTSARYPHLRRGDYNVITKKHVDDFCSFLKEPHAILTGLDNVDKYNIDWLSTVKGASQLVLRPSNTNQVSDILKYCYNNDLAVVPQGGNTGLVGGSVPVFDEVVVSMERMHKIINVNSLSGVLTCEGGCVLQDLDNHVSEHDLIMPYDLGAKGSCQIGGNLSTNAGGLRLVRYGSLHGSVLGLEAVLADGTIIDCMSSMRKDNTGYDMKHLFIGSEGTLGIITKVAMLCPRKPQNIQVAFLGCNSFEDALTTYQCAQSSLSEILSAFEYMDSTSMEVVKGNLGLSNPLSDQYNHYLLIETSGSDSVHDEEKLSRFLEHAMSTDMITDGTLATDSKRVQNLWSIRERIAEGLLKDGYNYKYDISLPRDQYYNIVDIMRERLGDSVLRVIGYGHLGDGNLHLNMSTSSFDREVKSEIESFLFAWISDHGGSISAEHGMGLMKNEHIHYSKAENTVNLMHQIKQLLDHKNILNPYKTLPTRK